MGYPAVFARLLAALPAACEKVYGNRLEAVAVFGSVARGTMRPDSDIDLLLVANALPAGRLARMREFAGVEAQLAPQLAQAENEGVQTLLSPVFKTPEELAHGSLLFLDMVDEARLLYDRAGMLAAYLARLREKLARAGAERVSCAGGYYWRLKPGARWGEPIEL